MKTLTQSNRFDRDMALMMRRGADVDHFAEIIEVLLDGKQLPPRNRDHNLSGNWAGHRECHITNDWLLIYKHTEDAIRLERTGTHSDLFR